MYSTDLGVPLFLKHIVYWDNFHKHAKGGVDDLVS